MADFSMNIVPESKVSDMMLSLPTVLICFVDVPEPQIVETFEQICKSLQDYVAQTFGFIPQSDVRARKTHSVLYRIELAKTYIRDMQCPTHECSAHLGRREKNDAARLALFDLIARINLVVLETDIMDNTYPA